MSIWRQMGARSRTHPHPLPVEFVVDVGQSVDVALVQVVVVLGLLQEVLLCGGARECGREHKPVLNPIQQALHARCAYSSLLRLLQRGTCKMRDSYVRPGSA